MIRIPFFGDSHDDASQDASRPTNTAQKTNAAATEHPLDARTGGIFSAATSGERAAKVRAWLATEPDAAAMQEVYKELSLRDKGAAKALREKLDEIKRSKGQETLAAEWAARAEALLQAARFNIADAMAWQRDAAKAGAPLSREPLQALKARLAERIQHIEDLQTRTQVQREAAALLAQRIELLSTRSWREADTAQPGLHADVQHWHNQTQQLQHDANWPHVDARYTQPLDNARQQLDLVVNAFMEAMEQARSADTDSSKPLPSVPIWADELRAARGESAASGTPGTPPGSEPSGQAAEQAQATHTARQLEAQQTIQPLLQTLEKELAGGHSKTATAAAQALRTALKEHARFLPATLEAASQAALSKALELESWQRWRADQLRTELVQKAEALIHRPAAAAEPTPDAAASETPAPTPAAPAADASAASTLAPSETDAATAEAAPAPLSASASASETSTGTADAASASTGAAPSSADKTGSGKQPATELPTSPHSPRKLQELLRQLREQWKEVDQGGIPNHALWRRFDQACNEAYRIVQAWLSSMKQQAAEQKALRLALLNELKTWGDALAARAAQATDPIDWKAVHRELGDFSKRWREAGHVSEKVFAELQPQWKAALQQAAKPLDAVQQASISLRQQLIEQAQALGSGMLRIDAIKELQQRWQHEAQRVSLERRQEQKLWDAFRKPIDLAFQRRSQQREQTAATASLRDQAVLQAAQALDAAVASGDAQAIRNAMQTLETAMRAQQTAAATAATADTASAAVSASSTHASPSQAAAPTEETAAARSEACAANIDAAVTAEASAAANGEEAASNNAPTGTQATDDGTASETTSDAATATTPTAVAAATPRPVVAMRGDDRPGARITTTASNKPAARAERDARRPARGEWRGDSADSRRYGKRPLREESRGPRPHAPRLSDAAFRAQRDAVERAQTTLRKLAAQAHGETLVQVLTAWEQRAADQIPPVNALGKTLNHAQRNLWLHALRNDATASPLPASEALLRLEIAADAPTPAEHLDARRALQLQLLTRRNDPAPAETWAEDVAHVLSNPYDAAQAKRLQNALRLLLKR